MCTNVWQSFDEIEPTGNRSRNENSRKQNKNGKINNANKNKKTNSNAKGKKTLEDTKNGNTTSNNTKSTKSHPNRNPHLKPMSETLAPLKRF